MFTEGDYDVHKLLLTAATVLALSSPAFAGGWSFGRAVNSWDDLLGGAWNFISGAEYYGGDPTTLKPQEANNTNGPSYRQLGCTGCTDIVAGQGGGYITHYVQTSKQTTWNGPNRTTLSSSELNDRIATARKSDVRVTSIGRPTGWTSSGLPGTVGQKFTKPDGSSVTYTVNMKASFDRRLQPVPYDPNNCTTPGC